MNSSNSALMNRLILLVLCLNLVCLVMLVVRSYQKSGREQSQALPPREVIVQRAWAPEPTLEEPPTPKPPPSRPVVRQVSSTVAPRPVTKQTVVQPIPSPSDELALAAPVLAPAPLVNLPSRSSGGIRHVGPPNDGRLPVLSGHVVLRGEPRPEIPIDLGPTCSSLNPSAATVTTRHYVVGPEGGLANVLVWLKNAAPMPEFAAMEEELPVTVLDQVGCMFQPYVLAVTTGQSFLIRNSEPVLHNIHATPQKNREINFAQASSGSRKLVSFPTPEFSLRIKCDVHPWMFAYVHVLPHPYFSLTDTNGAFRIPSGFPAGKYVVGAAHLKAGTIEQEIRLRDGEQRELNFELTVPLRAQAQAR